MMRQLKEKEYVTFCDDVVGYLRANNFNGLVEYMEIRRDLILQILVLGLGFSFTGGFEYFTKMLILGNKYKDLRRDLFVLFLISAKITTEKDELVFAENLGKAKKLAIIADNLESALLCEDIMHSFTGAIPETRGDTKWKKYEEASAFGNK